METLLTSCSVSVQEITSSFSRAPPSSFSRQKTRDFHVSSTTLQSVKSRSSNNSERLWGNPAIRCETGSGTVSAVRPTEWVQKQFELPGFSRGCHIITRGIVSAVPEIKEFEVGIAHIFEAQSSLSMQSQKLLSLMWEAMSFVDSMLHTSCSLTINENASPDVPLDMEDSLNRLVPEGHHYRHLDEGLDDMPAHVKASMMGSSLTIPIRGGRLNLGIWQGIWLNEHRNYGGPRTMCVTIQGQKRADGRVYK